MAQTDTILVQGFGDDDMLHARRIEPAAFGQIGHPAETTGFLVRSAADLDRACEIGIGGDEGLRRDDRGRQPALHVTGPTAIDPAVTQFAAERIDGPAVPDHDHIGVGVEVNALPGPRPLTPCDDVPAGIPVTVTQRPLGPDQRHVEAGAGKPVAQILANLAVSTARRVQRGHADQVLRQRDQILTPCLDRLVQIHEYLRPAQVRPRDRVRSSRCHGTLQRWNRVSPAWN